MRVSKKHISKKHIIALLAVVFSVLLSSFGYYFYQVLFSANVLLEKAPQGVIIHAGTTLRQLVKDLKREGVIEDAISFAFVSRVLDYDKQIKPGYYQLASNMNNWKAVRLLRSGGQMPVQVRFHQVRLIEDIPLRVAGQLALSPDSLLVALCSDSVAQSYGFDRDNFALMFIPNTYELYWTTDTDGFLARMKWEYDRFWNTHRRKQADSLGLSPIEVGILASIVQAETNKASEKSTIAGVYLNRLRLRMSLGADPTLVFAWQDFSITRVLNKHKAVRSPYNTYRRKGLPPGPINLPEIASLTAVLQAEKHDYLYFCAKDDFSGHHVFSKNLRTHQRYARRYQRALNERRRNK